MFMMIFYFSRVTDLTYAKSAPGTCKGCFQHRKTYLRTGTDRKVSFVLEPLVPTESSQEKGKFLVRIHNVHTPLCDCWWRGLKQALRRREGFQGQVN